MTNAFDAEHVARARLTYLAEPGDPVLASWLEVSPATGIVAAISAGRLPELPGIQAMTSDGGLRRTRDLQAEKLAHAFRLWRQRRNGQIQISHRPCERHGRCQQRRANRPANERAG